MYRELKGEIEFEEYLKYVKGAPSRSFLKFRLGTHGLFEVLGRHAGGDGSQECRNCGACKESVEHVLFECTSYNSQRQNFLDYLKQVLLPDAFEDFMHRSVLDKTVFCLGEKQGMIVNDDCSLWYNRVGDFLMLVWERRKENLYGKGSVCTCIRFLRTTPLLSVKPMAIIVMAVECEWFIYLTTKPARPKQTIPMS